MAYGDLNASPIQQKNLETLQKFFHRELLEGQNISVLFAEDGVKQFFRPNGELWQFKGREAIGKNFTSNKTVFTDWKHGEVKFHLTNHPDFIWALTYGSGYMKIPEFEGPFSNYYVDAFWMENGLIKSFTEYNNPEHLLHDFAQGKLAAHPKPC